jgi:glycosyltransferase involved in cell wall biosynthesis
MLVVAHSCVWSWWHACRGADPCEERWRIYAANVRAGLAATDRWVAPSTAFRDRIQALYTPPAPGHVIWNGLRSSPCMTPKQPIILAGGRLCDEAKNIGALAAAAPSLPWPIRIAGPLAAEKGGAADRRLAAEVTWLGALSHRDLLAEMRDAAIFAAPAVYEPFGLTVLEAASAGCALVLADIPTFRELWEGAALFVDPRDQAMLAATLARVTADAPLRRTLQRRAAFRAQRYSLDAMCENYCRLYERMVGIGALVHASPRPPAVEARP